MANRVGTSGWSYDAWKGRFYPEDLSSGDMLSFYAERLAAVEAGLALAARFAALLEEDS